METIVQIAQLVLALSILVGIHEAGHMIAAKYFGMKVEKFFIGFPPKIFGFKRGETEYGLGAIPLGGFVKISGMMDESMDKEAMAQEPKPWEFRSKPAWQRLIVMLGGIIVNVAAGIIAFIIFTYNVGETYLSSDVIKENGIIAGKIAQEAGFQTGDKVLKINGSDYYRFTEIWGGEALLESDGYWTVDRNGKIEDIKIPRGFINELEEINENPGSFLDFRRPYKVGLVTEGQNAEAAGLKNDDIIKSIGGFETKYFDQLRPALENKVGQTVDVNVRRGNDDVTLQIEVAADTTLGFAAAWLFEPSRKDYSFGEAITTGTGDAFSAVILNARAMGKMFSGEVSARSMSGPIGIVNFFPKAWDWNRFLYILGFLSMVLAFMNLLPIPALDGGHVLFLLYELVSGKAPSDKFLENAQKVGMVIILALMVFVLGNDILKLFGL